MFFSFGFVFLFLVANFIFSFLSSLSPSHTHTLSLTLTLSPPFSYSLFLLHTHTVLFRNLVTMSTLAPADAVYHSPHVKKYNTVPNPPTTGAFHCVVDDKSSAANGLLHLQFVPSHTRDVSLSTINVTVPKHVMAVHVYRRPTPTTATTWYDPYEPLWFCDTTHASSTSASHNSALPHPFDRDNDDAVDHIASILSLRSLP